MAKKSITHRDYKKMSLAQRLREKRNALRDLVKRGTEEEAVSAMLKLNKSRRNESMVRTRTRCGCCGRPRATLRRFGLCRICLRQAAMRGDVPGLRKASW